MNSYSKSLVAILLTIVWSGVSAQEPVSSKPQNPPKTTTGSAEWLKGKWEFDEEYTKQKLTQAKKEPVTAQEGLGEALIVPQLLEKLKGAHITFTDKETIMTTKDGNGRSTPYEVLEVKPDGSVTTKEHGGEVTTYHKDGERFWSASTGSVNAPFYFKRVAASPR